MYKKFEIFPKEMPTVEKVEPTSGDQRRCAFSVHTDDRSPPSNLFQLEGNLVPRRGGGAAPFPSQGTFWKPALRMNGRPLAPQQRVGARQPLRVPLPVPARVAVHAAAAPPQRAAGRALLEKT